MEKSKKASLIKRAVTSLVLAPLTLAALWYGTPYINVMTLLFGTALAWEWSTMVPNKKQAAFASIYATALAVVASSMDLSLITISVAVATLVAFMVSKGEKHRFLLVLGAPYVAIGVGSTLWFYYLMGPILMLWLMFMVWGMDVGGFIAGNIIKGPKLAPKVSPNKTWSGFLGGIALAVGFSVLFVKLFATPDAYVSFAVYAILVAVLAQVGDLIESAIKRKVGVKDSSALIPGHGGVFDRIDGLIFATPLVILALFVATSFMG